ncbi:MAG TPA: hypothetical protein VIL72_15350, partial [Beijerinckiaceae bacterium]
MFRTTRASLVLGSALAGLPAAAQTVLPEIVVTAPSPIAPPWRQASGGAPSAPAAPDPQLQP